MDTVPSIEPAINTPSPAVPPKKHSINWKFEIIHYLRVIIAVIPLFILLSVYLYFRRGYYDLYIINKILAGLGAIMIGLVLLIGPGSRMFSFPDRYLQYRKHLGIVAFFFILPHGLVSLFFLPSKFPLSDYIGTINFSFYAGLTDLLILSIIFVISNYFSMMKLGHSKWWHIQNWGVRIAFALTFLHVYIMKWNGWLSWYKNGGGKELVHPEWPGAGLLVGWFILFVIAIRLAEAINSKTGHIMWYISFVALPLIYIATFVWGNQFAK